MFGDVVRGEMDVRCYRGEGAMVIEKSEKEKITQGNKQGDHFPNTIGLENKRD